MKPVSQLRMSFQRRFFYRTFLLLLSTMGLLGCDSSPQDIYPTLEPSSTPTPLIIEPSAIPDWLPTPPDTPLEQEPLSNYFADYETLNGSAETIAPPTLTTPQEAALAVVRISGCDGTGNCVDTNQGSGAIIHPHGIILTAWHVTILDHRNRLKPDYYDHFRVEITDDISQQPEHDYMAHLIAHHIRGDLALLRIVSEYGSPQEGGQQPIVDYPWLPISNDMQPAQLELWLMGYPQDALTVNFPVYRFSSLEGNRLKIPEPISNGYSGGPALVQKADGYEIVGVVSSRVQNSAFIESTQQLENLIWLPQEQMWAEQPQIVAATVDGRQQAQLEITVHTLGYRSTAFNPQAARLLLTDDQENKAQQRLEATNFVTIQQLTLPLEPQNQLFDQPLFVSIFHPVEGEVWRVADWIRPPTIQPQVTPSATATDTPRPIATSPPIVPTPTVMAAVTLTDTIPTVTPVPPTATTASTPMPITNTPLITPTTTSILSLEQSSPALTATAKANMIAESVAATLAAQPTATATWTPHLARTATTEAQMKSATATAESEEIATAAAATLTAVAPTATATPEAGTTYLNPVDNATYLYVPGGEFMMGSVDGSQDERPIHTVYLDGYWIMQTEVTNAQYSLFMGAGGYTTEAYWSVDGWAWRTQNNITEPDHYWRDNNFNRPDQPVIGVSWYEAQAYANWLSIETGLDFGLPTEAQWEKAARGDDSRVYPWGNQWHESKANSSESNDGYPYTAPVGSYPAGASPYGALDMAGNVREWTTDWYAGDYYQGSPIRNPTGPASGTRRVLRGGSWRYFSFNLRAAYRLRNLSNFRDDAMGIRLRLSSAPN